MANPTISSVHVPTVLDPAKSEIFYDGFVSEEVEWPELFLALGTDSATIEKASLLPPGSYNAAVQGDDIPTMPLEDGVAVTYTLAEFTIGYEIAAFAWRFLRTKPEVGDFIRQIGLSAMRRINQICMTVISGGFTVNGPDGVPLYSNSHDRGDGSGTLVDNLGTTALDVDAIEATMIAGMQMVSPEGLIAPVYYDTICCAVGNFFTANQSVTMALKNDVDGTAVRQTHTPNTAGRRVARVIATPEFTDSNDWEMFCSSGWRGEAYFAQAPNPKAWEDPDSGNYKVTDRIIVVAGHRNSWRHTYGHRVA
mgnify:CR=1 FL=1